MSASDRRKVAAGFFALVFASAPVLRPMHERRRRRGWKMSWLRLSYLGRAADASASICVNTIAISSVYVCMRVRQGTPSAERALKNLKERWTHTPPRAAGYNIMQAIMINGVRADF